MNWGKEDHPMRTMAQFEADEREANLRKWQPERDEPLIVGRLGRRSLMPLNVQSEILGALLTASRAIDAERRRIEGHVILEDQKAELAALNKAWEQTIAAFEAVKAIPAS